MNYVERSIELSLLRYVEKLEVNRQPIGRSLLEAIIIERVGNGDRTRDSGSLLSILPLIEPKEKQMARWTEQGEQLVNDVANRYGASYEAVSLMLDSVLRGNGTMAQFNIYELGGGGQWMRGGMTMVGDMFNYQLKGKVDGICSDLSSAIVDQNMQVVPPPPPRPAGTATSGPSQNNWNNWWGADLGIANTSGSQNQYRYAYFAGSRRLAISDGQNVTIYDTLDHNIGGVSQQQGGVAGVGFTSQYGNVDLRSLPLVSGPALGSQSLGSQSLGSQSLSSQAQPNPVAAAPVQSQASTYAQTPLQVHSTSLQNQPQPSSSDDIFAMIERLAKLRDAGAINDDEFVSKKTELLGRL